MKNVLSGNVIITKKKVNRNFKNIHTMSSTELKLNRNRAISFQILKIKKLHSIELINTVNIIKFNFFKQSQQNFFHKTINYGSVVTVK